MNFKYMNEEAWLLDDDILLRGIVKRKWFRYIFIPNNFGCGFEYQYVTKKDIGKTLFRNDIHIVYAGLGHLVRVCGDKSIRYDDIGDCSNCANYTEYDEVDNGCYMCGKGLENNFIPIDEAIEYFNE